MLAYLGPVLVFSLHLWLRDTPAIATSPLYRGHQLWFDGGVALLAASVGALAIFLLLRLLMRPWLSLEEELSALVGGRMRIAPVGEVHADRVVERINRLLDLQRDYFQLLELEKNQLAQSLHDEVVQTLIAGRWSLAQGRLEEVEHDLREAEATLRRVLTRLNPPELEYLSLNLALAQLAQRLRVEAQIEVQEPQNEDDRVAAYRIVQNALSNAVRHGAAGRVWIRVASAAWMEVRVEDDGSGGEVKEGQGIRLLRAWMRLRGGTLFIDSSLHGGIAITARWPAKVAGEKIFRG